MRAAEGVVESLLPVIDNMQRALEAAAKHEEGQLIAGVELVADQLHTVLSSHGLEELPAEPGMSFDPNVHEAVLTQPAPSSRRAPCSACSRRATCCTAPCCGRPRSSWPSSHARLLRDSRRVQERLPGRGEEGVPQAGARAPPRQEPRRQEGRGALQGGQRRLRDDLGPQEAQAVRRDEPAGRLRPRRRLPPRARRRPGVRPAHLHAGRRAVPDGRLRRHLSNLFGGAAGGAADAAAGRRPSAAPTCRWP